MADRKPVVYAIVPARSGSKGVPNKNIRNIGGKPLLAFSIEFALRLGADRVFCSTDSPEYASIAERHGAEVPFLRSPEASHDKAMEEHILTDLYNKFDIHQIEYPDIFVWLRPTFVFRSREVVVECIEKLANNPQLTSTRAIVETESRLYRTTEGRLIPAFNDHGKSMIRRQDVEKGYKVYSVDVFRGKPKNCSDKFLGDTIGYVIAPKICGLDVDDEIDLSIVEIMMRNHPELVNEYL